MPHVLINQRNPAGRLAQPTPRPQRSSHRSPRCALKSTVRERLSGKTNPDASLRLARRRQMNRDSMEQGAWGWWRGGRETNETETEWALPRCAPEVFIHHDRLDVFPQYPRHHPGPLLDHPRHRRAAGSTRWRCNAQRPLRARKALKHANACACARAFMIVRVHSRHGYGGSLASEP